MQSVPRNSSKSTTQSQRRPGWNSLSFGDLKDLGQKVKDHFKWKHTPREFQLEAIKAQLLRRDVLIHAGTGSGKTFVAAGPYAHQGTKGMVTIMVSPLIALQEEQAKSFQEDFGLKAIAINSAHGGCTREIMADICTGRWQVVVISPEMLLSKRFIANVLRNPEMRQKILSVVVDEAHVVSHWGSGFRKKYGTLGILRALLPKDTPMVAMSATLPPRVRTDVINKLQFDENNYTYLNLGNDRPNVSLVVRAIQNAINTYSDVDFLIPATTHKPDDVEKAFLYVDNITVGSDMMEHLYEISPATFRGAGIIRTYSSAFSKKYRQEVMELFKAGHVRILICTDAAGMGCNIPDIDIVVQWKLPSTVSSFVQRAGRAARGYGRSGLAVLLVEKSAYDLDLTGLVNQTNKPTKRKGNVREATAYPKSKDKNYAINHGVLRGAFGGGSDTIPLPIEVPLDLLSLDEGLHTLVQTTECRRKVLTAIYVNQTPDPTVPCCDLCSPELLDKTRPAPPSRNSRRKGQTPGVIDKELKQAIITWRKEIWSRDFGDSLFHPAAILSNAAVNSLSSFGPVERLIDLEIALGGYWIWFGKYGDELLTLFRTLKIGPKKKKPPKLARVARGSKRTAEVAGVEEGVGGDRKRHHHSTDIAGSATPTPVNPQLAPSTSHTVPPLSTPLRPPGYSYPHHPQPGSLANNPYAALLSPSSHFYAHPSPYMPVPSPYHYHPSSLSPSQLAPNTIFYPYQYPIRHPGPPPPPNM